MGWRMLPSTRQQTAARKWINEKYQQNLTFPTFQVPELTEQEKAIQSMSAGTLQSGGALYDQMMKYYSDVLAGGYDPRTSTYYSGLRQESEDLKAQSNSALLRGQQRGGMFGSLPNQRVLSENTRKYDTALTTQLGGLYENERSRMGQAAAAIPQAEGQRISNLGAGYQIAQTERMVEAQKAQAEYDQIVNTMLAPYQYQYQLAMALLSEQRYYYKQKSSGTNWGQIAGSLIGSFAGPAW